MVDFIAPVIVAQNLQKKFGELVAVDGISFTVEESEVFGFLGPNGAGKTTAMRMIQCVSPKDEGKLEVFGMDVNTHQKEIKKNIGVVPQENNLDPDFTVYENLFVYSRYFDIPKEESKERVNNLLEFVQLEEKKDVMTYMLSGGMKRRLILARALVNNPSLLILDEPTVGLDPQARHLLWEKIRGLKKQNVTIVLTTHYLEEAAYLCDRLVIMDYGKILVEGEPDDIVKKYIGSDVVEVDNTKPVISCLNKTDINYETLDSTVQIYTNEPKDISDRLMKECEFEKITVRSATLEDVFLKLTGRKLRE